MTSDSERYIQLQTAYQDKATEDITCVTSHLHTLLQTIGWVGTERPSVMVAEFLTNVIVFELKYNCAIMLITSFDSKIYTYMSYHTKFFIILQYNS